MKKIKIYTGDTDAKYLFEKGLHPKNQIKKVIKLLEASPNNLSVFTNSPHVAEAFNKFGKEKNYTIECYFENEKVLSEIMFREFSKPFEELVFGDEK